jgi:hypothetical protein
MSAAVAKAIRYRLRLGVDRAGFLAASDAVGPELETIPGYLRRELLEEDDGSFGDVVCWRSMSDAQRSTEAIAAQPDSQTCIALMDASTMQVAHLSVVQAQAV